MNTPKLDPSKLTEEQRDRLDKWNQGKQTLRALSDLTAMVQDIVMTMDSRGKKDKKTVDSIGALLVDMRDSLTTLKDKKDPELPDYAKPITDAFGKLEKAIKAIDVKPEVRVDAPQVNVDTPPVSIDLKGVEKLLKTDIPKAFKESMKLVPKPDKFDPKPLLVAYKELGKKLDDIDTGVRMKQAGVNAKITNSSDITTGLATSAKQDTAQTALDAIKTAVETIDNAISGSEMQVDVLTMPTVTTTETVPTTIYNGKKTVTTAGTRVTLASSQAVKSVTIKALSTNTGLIYVGDTSVASTNGFQLSAGETISMDIANLNTVNLDSAVNGEGVTYIGIN